MDFLLGVQMAGPADPVLLYAHPSMDQLARQIVEKCSKSRAQLTTLLPDAKPPVSYPLLLKIYIIKILVINMSHEY